MKPPPIDFVNPNDPTGTARIDQRMAAIRQHLIDMDPEEAHRILGEIAVFQKLVASHFDPARPMKADREWFRVRGGTGWVMSMLALYGYNAIMGAEYARRAPDAD